MISYFQLLVGTNNSINKSMSDFFWNGSRDQRKFPLIKWQKVCEKKEKDGVGLKNMLLQNKALGAKLVWKVHTHPKLKWVKIVKAKYLDNEEYNFLKEKSLPNGSCIWNFIKHSRDLIMDYLTWEVKSGEDALFWEDSWEGFPNLADNPLLARVREKSK